MTLEQVHKLFRDTLADLYDQKEISNFFFLLTGELMGYSRIQVSLNRAVDIGEELSNRYRQALERLQNYEPLQYIMGKTEFYGLEFEVNPSVLIPRPETEELVDWILNDHPETQETVSVLDIGTGSGCIAVSLAKNRPRWRITGLDVSEDALDTAARNAKRNRVDVRFRNADIFEPSSFETKFDIIVSNPPYVREMERKEMSPNVIDFEPTTALFVSDSDPLIYYDAICELALRQLSGGGHIYLEINENLSEESIELLNGKGFTDVLLRRDFREKDRMVRAEIGTIDQ